MSLAFLYPLAWLGALAVAAPVWLHLRRERPSALVRFSALRFLDDQTQPRRRPLRPRDLLLLALRVLGLLLLVAAFAWPYTREPPKPVATESRVYILDNTMSHQADGGFSRDRDRLRDELAAAGREVQVAVVELTGQPRVAAGFGDDRAAAARVVAGLTPSHQRGSYLAAFRTANTLLSHSLGRKKRIVLLGDSQENQWGENPGVPAFLQGVEVELPTPRAPQAPNLSLSNPRVHRVLLGDRALIDLNVDLGHLGPADSATVTVRSDGKEVLRREIPLADEPATITLGTRWETGPAVGLRGEVTVEGRPDALEPDNRVVFALPPVAEGKVLVLADSTYLRTALAPEIMRGRWSARVVEPSELGTEPGSKDDADVLVVESHYLQSAGARELVRDALRGGRGVLLLIDRDTPLVHGFLLGLGFDIQGETTAPTSIRYAHGGHPVFHPFRSPDFGDLTEVTVLRHRRVKASQAVPLVFGESGDALFFQGASTTGRLFVCTFGFDRAQTNWPLHPTFLPFLDLCLQNARARDELPADFEPGESAVMSVPPGGPPRDVVLSLDDREVARAPVTNGRVQLRIPDAPGLYMMTGAAGPSDERAVGVNPPPRESQLTYAASPGAVKTWHLDPATRKSDDTPAPAGLTRAVILGQHHWWALLLAGASALLGESAWLAARGERS